MLSKARIITAMVTPFDEQGDLALDKLPALIEYLIANHTEGLVVGGTTGESPTLNEEEALELFKATVALVAGRIPVICGVGSNDTRKTIAFTQKVAQIDGVAAGLVVVPYYNRPNQEGLYQHFKAVAEASELPIILYNVPSRTSVNLDVATTLRLAELENVIGVKECSGIEALAIIKGQAPADFLVYTGEDSLAFTTKTIGANGVISVASHVLGPEMFTMYEQLAQGEMAEAAALFCDLVPKIQAVFSVPSPAPIKAVLAHRGLDVGSLRLPLVACTPAETENILMILNQ